MSITLYAYWRSSAAYRVRIALYLKEAAFDIAPVSLAPGVSEQRGDAYREINPQMRIPSLEVDGKLIGQSMAMLEWIEETLGGPSLLPDTAWDRAACRAFANIIASDIHPIQNLSILGRLRSQFDAGDDAVADWARTCIRDGFTALETLTESRSASTYLFGDRPSFADICLVPQMYNARRFDLNLAPFPRLVAADAVATAHPAFRKAAPEAQPDAP